MTEILQNNPATDGLTSASFPDDSKIRNVQLPVCVGCGFIIRDPYILCVSPNLEWHSSCLKCFECNQFLDESCTCFVKNGKAYCKRDYLKLFGIKCFRCQQPFSRNDLVMRARNFIYHTRCFSCYECHKPLTPGDEFYLKGPDQSLLFCNRHDPDSAFRITNEFGGDLGANNNHRELMEYIEGPPGQERLLESIANGNGLINGSTLKYNSNHGAGEAFKTKGLTNGFGDGTNGRRHKSGEDEDDELIDSPHYTQIDGMAENLTNPKISHVSSSEGLLLLSPHDHHNASKLNPAASYLDKMTSMMTSADDNDVGDDVIHDVVDDDSNSSLAYGSRARRFVKRRRRDSRHDIDDDAEVDGDESPDGADEDTINQMTSSPTSQRHAHHHHHGGYLSQGGHGKQHHTHHGHHIHHGTGGSGGDKVTRVRTVLNEKQLHTLRTCYNANPRPDALMKEQLVEMTSLSPRVIRVWFQNKRCKDKKRQILMKQISQAQEKGIANMHGIPMVASSPVRHEQGPFSSNYMEIQTYHSPWKALNDFAMQNEIESQPFQQLI